MISLSQGHAGNMDRQFLTIVESVLNNVVRINRPADVYVALIDNWFDHKWLEFESSTIDNDALGWRKKLALPRFEPNRVVGQAYFHAEPSDPLSFQARNSKPLHLWGDRRFLSQFCSSGVFAWYSHVGATADRASLMIYLNCDGRGSAWYASFVKNPDWCINKLKNVSKLELSELMVPVNLAGGSQPIVGREPR